MIAFVCSLGLRKDHWINDVYDSVASLQVGFSDFGVVDEHVAIFEGDGEGPSPCRVEAKSAAVTAATNVLKTPAEVATSTIFFCLCESPWWAAEARAVRLIEARMRVSVLMVISFIVFIFRVKVVGFEKIRRINRSDF